jgi:hypothetical protein
MFCWQVALVLVLMVVLALKLMVVEVVVHDGAFERILLL